MVETLVQKIQEISSDDIGHKKITIPLYERKSFENVICHIGVGGFHRSHLAVYIHKLLQVQHDNKIPANEHWGIKGIGILESDRKMYTTLKKQDFLYSVLTLDANNEKLDIIGSIFDFVFTPDHGKKKAIDDLAEKKTKIISFTITEKGYCLNSSGEIDLEHALIKADLADFNKCSNVFSLILLALKLRKEKGLDGVTLLSCDNIPENGLVLKKAILTLAKIMDPSGELNDWISNNVTFPMSMVDRITPVTTDYHRRKIETDYGVADEWPVIAEDYTQWACEDVFFNNLRPKLEVVKPAPLFVQNVIPYEKLKLRLLNGGHSVLSYTAKLKDYKFVHEAMEDELIVTFLRKYFKEVEVTLPVVEGIDITEYQQTLIERFSNKQIQDQIDRLAQDGVTKFLNTCKDTILERNNNIGLRREGKEGFETLAVALSCFLLYITDNSMTEENKTKIPNNDSMLKALALIITSNCHDHKQRNLRVETFLEMVFGEEILECKAFVFQVKSKVTETQMGKQFGDQEDSKPMN